MAGAARRHSMWVLGRQHPGVGLYDAGEMVGDEVGRVKSLRPFPLHGLSYWDVAVEFDDGHIEQARLGPEGVPEGLQLGDRVLVKKAAMMIIGLERDVEGF